MRLIVTLALAATLSNGCAIVATESRQMTTGA
jgi:hypothetical protein